MQQNKIDMNVSHVGGAFNYYHAIQQKNKLSNEVKNKQ